MKVTRVAWWLTLLMLGSCSGGSVSEKEDTLAACSDKRDNDGDGQIDCADQDCRELLICARNDAAADGPSDVSQPGDASGPDGVADITETDGGAEGGDGTIDVKDGGSEPDAPAEIPADASVDSPAEPLAEVPVDAPVDAAIDTPVEGPIDASVDTPIESPADGPIDAVEGPVDGPGPEVPCPVGFTDCDGEPSNGCEVETASDKLNCGTCGKICGSAFGDPSCTAGACVIACHPDREDCDDDRDDGCEVNTADDKANCGTCGKICYAGSSDASCTGGTCSLLMAETAIDSAAGADKLFVDATHIYFHTLDKVMKTPKSLTGNTMPTLLAGETEPFVYVADMLVDSTHVYYVSTADQIKKVALGGGTVSPVGPMTSGILNLRADASRLYWENAGVMRSMDKAGGVVSDVGTTPCSSADLGVDATRLYWTGGGCGTVSTVLTGVGTVDTIASSETTPLGRLEVGTTKLYWIAGGYCETSHMRSAPKAGGMPAATVPGGDGITYFVLDEAAGTIYMVDGGPCGGFFDIYKMPIAGGARTLVAATKDDGTLAIALDATSVYYAAYAPGVLRIYKAAR